MHFHSHKLLHVSQILGMFAKKFVAVKVCASKVYTIKYCIVQLDIVLFSKCSVYSNFILRSDESCSINEIFIQLCIFVFSSFFSLGLLVGYDINYVIRSVYIWSIKMFTNFCTVICLQFLMICVFSSSQFFLGLALSDMISNMSFGQSIYHFWHLFLSIKKANNTTNSTPAI